VALCALIVGRISGEDAMYPEVVTTWDALWDRVPAVTYDGVGAMKSVPQFFFGMIRLATLLPSLGWAKLVQRSWIWIPKQSSPS
jgi:hypothetical protein